MCNWAGRFKTAIILFFYFLTSQIILASEDIKITSTEWEQFALEVNKQRASDYRNGLSYMISGSLALAGGIWGSNITKDPAEKGIYTVFQSIGIASIGYGAYTWQIGEEDRTIYRILANTRFTNQQRSLFLKAYASERAERERKERWIRALTHGLISGINFYNASQQNNQNVKNGLNFIGGVNLLAAISFTF
jgi:hypothetical protein